LDEREVEAAVDALVAGGVESIAICLLHSYIDPRHERRVADSRSVTSRRRLRRTSGTGLSQSML
ncbi:MAG: hypothetical protein EOO54_28975, partial [Haliea sp.]